MSVSRLENAGESVAIVENDKVTNDNRSECDDGSEDNRSEYNGSENDDGFKKVNNKNTNYHCDFCGEDGHSKKSCDKLRNTKCMGCHKLGHTNRYCPDNPNKCTNCGKPGHATEDCYFAPGKDAKPTEYSPKVEKANKPAVKGTWAEKAKGNSKLDVIAKRYEDYGPLWAFLCNDRHTDTGSMALSKEARGPDEIAAYVAYKTKEHGEHWLTLTDSDGKFVVKDWYARQLRKDNEVLINQPVTTYPCINVMVQALDNVTKLTEERNRIIKELDIAIQVCKKAQEEMETELKKVISTTAAALDEN